MTKAELFGSPVLKRGDMSEQLLENLDRHRERTFVLHSGLLWQSLKFGPRWLFVVMYGKQNERGTDDMYEIAKADLSASVYQAKGEADGILVSSLSPPLVCPREWYDEEGRWVDSQCEYLAREMIENAARK